MGTLEKANIPHTHAEKGNPRHKLITIVFDILSWGNNRREISIPRGKVTIAINSKEILFERTFLVVKEKYIIKATSRKIALNRM